MVHDAHQDGHFPLVAHQDGHFFPCGKSDVGGQLGFSRFDPGSALLTPHSRVDVYGIYMLYICYIYDDDYVYGMYIGKSALC